MDIVASCGYKALNLKGTLAWNRLKYFTYKFMYSKYVCANQQISIKLQRQQ